MHLLVQEKKNKTITYCFRFRNLSGNPSEEVARGIVTIVCVALHANGKMTAVPIPHEIGDKIKVAPAESLA